MTTIEQIEQIERDMVDVIPPPNAAMCVTSRKIPGRYYYAVEKSGRLVIPMPWSEFYALAFSVANGPGPNGGMWLYYNPHLANRLPQNLPPPLPEPPR
jgi:hypothetical protein